MTVYAAAPDTVSDRKGWGAETVYGRFTQRLITALSAPTADGELYPVDLQLRPSGTAGPVAVSLPGFERYYETEAETWELLALTRARAVWASSPAFAAEIGAAIEAALRRPRDPRRTAKDVLEMRALMTAERPASGFWDLKLGPGGLVDIEFAAQHLQLIHAAAGGPLRVHTGEALAAFSARPGLADPARIDALLAAWSLQQNLSQVLKLALADNANPAGGAGPFPPAAGARRWGAGLPRPARGLGQGPHPRSRRLRSRRSSVTTTACCRRKPTDWGGAGVRAGQEGLLRRPYDQIEPRRYDARRRVSRCGACAACIRPWRRVP